MHYKNVLLPCLFCHVHLVRSGQLIQMGLEHGLHLVPGRRGEGGCGLLSKGHSCWGRGNPSDWRGGNPLLLFLQLVLHALVKIGLHGHGRAPAITLIPDVRRDIYCTKVLTSANGQSDLGMQQGIITSTEEVMFLPVSVCWSVSLSPALHKNYKTVFMNLGLVSAQY